MRRWCEIVWPIVRRISPCPESAYRAEAVSKSTRISVKQSFNPNLVVPHRTSFRAGAGCPLRSLPLNPGFRAVTFVTRFEPSSLNVVAAPATIKIL